MGVGAVHVCEALSGAGWSLFLPCGRTATKSPVRAVDTPPDLRRQHGSLVDERQRSCTRKQGKTNSATVGKRNQGTIALCAPENQKGHVAIFLSSPLGYTCLRPFCPSFSTPEGGTSTIISTSSRTIPLLLLSTTRVSSCS